MERLTGRSTIFRFATLAVAAALALVMAVSGCATTPVPRELFEARQSYGRALVVRGSSLVPAELHKARQALDVAEQAFVNHPDDDFVRDLAYLADRKARLAEARAGAAVASNDKVAAVEALTTTKDRMARATRGALAQTRQELDAEKRELLEKNLSLELSNAALDKTSEQLQSFDAARRAAEQKAARALAELAAAHAIKEDDRGTVITIPGNVLFASGQWTILPHAQMRLDHVAQALTSRKETIVVEGHTDDRGADGPNWELSLKRAQSVREHLVGKGVPAERCRAIGLGKSHPVADNRTAEGRAANRRVEVVIESPRLSQR